MRFFSFSFSPDADSVAKPSNGTSEPHLTPNETRSERLLSLLGAILKSALLSVVVLMIAISLMSQAIPTPEVNYPVETHLAALEGSNLLSPGTDGDDFDPLQDEAKEEDEIPYEAYIDIFVRNADPDQPLLQHMDNAMPHDEFLALQDCLRDHPMRHWNVNDDNTFQGTKGFLLSFSEKGIEKFLETTQFNCLESYFRRHRLPNANAWVLNMVWAEIPDYTRELAIRRHTDDAIMLEFSGSKKVMPFQTNVLYVFVPEDMVGGQLEAWDYDITLQDVINGPKARVVPEENRMAFFRGDAQHQVRSYNTSSKTVLRGSLVLEQYAIPEDYQHLVVDWHWRDRHDSDMM